MQRYFLKVHDKDEFDHRPHLINIDSIAAIERLVNGCALIHLMPAALVMGSTTHLKIYTVEKYDEIEDKIDGLNFACVVEVGD